MQELIIDGYSLTIQDVIEVAFNENIQVHLDEAAKRRIQVTRKHLEDAVQRGETIYAVNTGFGFLKNTRIDTEKVRALQQNIIKSHSVGTGDPFSPTATRAILLIRANTLAQGLHGIRPDLVEYILSLLNHRIYPRIPQKGSLGASGDLAPLAHLGLAMMGEGDVWLNGKWIPAMSAFHSCGLKPFIFDIKEGISLINGTQVMAASLSVSIQRIETLLKSADIAAAMSVEALLGSQKAFLPIIQKVRPHPGQIATAHNLTRLLEKSEIMDSHKDCDRVQDAYSLRCTPQVHGAIKDVLTSAKKVLSIELNSVTDNPIYDPDQNSFVSGGNFHGEPLAFWADFLAIALCDLGNISERRIERLLNPTLSGLPPFLIKDSGLNSGFMAAQYTATALTSENKIYANPASSDSIPTSANQEDHVSMGMTACLKLESLLANLQTIISIELLTSAQGIEFRKPLNSGRCTSAAIKVIRTHIPFLTSDRPLYQDIHTMELILPNIIEAVEKIGGELTVA